MPLDGNDILGKFNPGLGAQSFDIDGSAKMIPKGSDFVFELHYTASGVATSDISKVGLVLAKNAALDALLSVARHAVGVEPGDSGGRRQRRSGGRKHRGRGREADLHPAAHAPARQGLRAAPDLSDRRNANRLQGQVGFQLAVGLRP